MIIDVECPRCNGTGEVLGATPIIRARYARNVLYEDLDPGDFGEACPKCGGSGGVVDFDPSSEIEDWMHDE